MHTDLQTFKERLHNFCSDELLSKAVEARTVDIPTRGSRQALSFAELVTRNGPISIEQFTTAFCRRFRFAWTDLR